MKKIYFILIIMFFGLFISGVSAENTMKYINTEYSDYYFVIDKDNFKEITINAVEKGRKYIITDFSIPDISEDWYGIEELEFAVYDSPILSTNPDGWWKHLYACSVDENVVAHVEEFGYISIYTEASDLPEENTKWFWEHFLGGTGVYCYKYKPEKELSPEQIIDQCDYYDDTVFTISAILKNYDNSDANTKISKLEAYNKEIEGLKSYCKSILSQTDYEEMCAQRCIKNLKSDIEHWNDTVDKKVSINSDCGVSNKLINWILNIIKWGKYLVPVIVIVLGILDFIKAMAADKDDEMKKAQGRFVKRLIAAALIFIIPFIIEFVLDKMGFGYNDCGLF